MFCLHSLYAAATHLLEQKKILQKIIELFTNILYNLAPIFDK